MGGSILGKAWRSYRRGGARRLWTDALDRIEARPTAVPLPGPLVEALRAGLARRSAATEPPPALPGAEELRALAPVAELQLRLLRGENPGDPYFQPAAPALLAKGLFEIWLFLRWRPGTLLEIGTRTGLSLGNKLAFLPPGHRTVSVCVDPYIEQGSPRTVRRNLKRLGADAEDVHFLVGDSKAMLPALRERLPDLRFDYVLVDGSHRPEDALADLQLTLPLLAPGGFLVFDDAGPTAPGIVGHDLIDVWRRAVRDHADRIETRHYAEPNGFCVARRNS